MLTRNYSEVNTQFSEMSIHSQKNARTMTVYAMSNSPESNSAFLSHFDCDDENRRYHTPRSCRSSWKRSLSNPTDNMRTITYVFIAYRTQRSILFCCTETNNILRAVSSSEDAVFSMRTFTWSWWLPVSLCRSVIGLNVEPYGLRLDTTLIGTCLRNRHLHEVER